MKIGDLFLALGIDSADFKTTITKEAEAAGKAGASTLSKSMAAGLKVGALLVGGAFALMTKGALQMEEAQGKFQAATGRSREEAIAFSKDMNDLVGTAGTVGMKFEDIAAAGIAVSQQFGITGQDAKDLTADILAFAKVTGQDAAQAAKDLEDLLSAFGLSADDAAGFMNVLVASNQKFGTDVGPETLSILNNMAPALTAMGMGLDDGVELLNAFEVAGLDAGSAQRGLQKAITELKPGETLDDLITQIGAIEDPTLRAQKAIQIFGTKAGAGLAAVIQPGMTSLDEFGVTAEESAGKVDQAASDMLTTTDKIKIFGETVGKALRGLGQDFGPLVTGLASVTTLAAPFAKSIGGMLLNVAKSAAVAFGGSTIGTAIGVALIEAQAAAQAGVAAIQKLVGSVLAAQIPMAAAGTTVGTAVGAAVSAGFLLGIAGIGVLGAVAAAKITVEGATAWMNTGRDAAVKFGEGWTQEVKDHYALVVQQAFSDASHHRMPFDQARAAGLAAGAAYLETMGITIAAGGPVVGAAMGEAVNVAASSMEAQAKAEFAHLGTVAAAAAADAAGQSFVQSKDQLADDARETIRFANQAMMAEAAGAKKVGDALADGLIAGIPSIRDAWKRYIEESKKALDPMEQMTWLQGKLSSQKLADGLTSNNPLQRRRSEEMRDAIIEQIAQLQQLMGIEGDQASTELAQHLDDSGPAAAAARIAAAVNAALDRIVTHRQILLSLGQSDIPRGARAAGGYTPPGAYLVGEHGPELRYFERPSYIVPHNRIGDVAAQRSMGDVTFNIDGSGDPQGVADKVMQALNDYVSGAWQARHVRYSSG